ncbi:MAG TPA: AraC family transcriptional regulator [Mucilaginibacter sp.]|nr:AraC family transcriptional regulator [Mucilaginibacter sp.]
MEDKTHIYFNNMLYSCVEKKQRGNEQFVPEHALGFIIAGESHLQTSGGKLIFGPGSIGLIRKNQLVKSVKVPPPGGEFKSVNIFLTQDFLRQYSTTHKLPKADKYTGEPMRLLSQDAFIKGYFDSLLPYFSDNAKFSSNIADLKTTEAVELLLQADPDFFSFLFDFSEPYKIDLEAYMNQHYMFNVPVAQFARLTGRSLAGFKRDFEKIFNLPPGQWLQQKRLAEAYYQIKEKGRRPSDVYLDVGFENLSHFSYTFKKSFGIAPSML